MIQKHPDRRRDDFPSVHVVSEHIFCHRAGLNAYLDDREDKGVEDPILRLDYQPQYDLDELEKQLEQAARVLWRLGIAAISFLVVGFLLGFVHGAFPFAGFLAFLFVGYASYKELPGIFKLLSDHRAARRAEVAEPVPSMSIDQPVNWWSLRAAGFVATPCEPILVDEEVGVQGRPWRILRRGNLAIPAYVRASNKAIRPQHRARIAAYCRMVQQNEGAEVPYGIILDRSSFEGTAVTPSPEDVSRLKRAASQSPSFVHDFVSFGREPGPPPDDSRCKRCPHGAPRVHGKRQTMSDGVPTREHLFPSGSNGGRYHSSCGDRFRWLPPHERASQLELA